MDGAVKAVFDLMGGLAMFLYGMRTMTDALERATGTPLRGALAGAGVTAVLQSSSAVTAAVIGFVGARLMDLPQAVAVIFGANVGTTVTGQLLAFRLADWIRPLLLAGLLLHLAAHGERMRSAGLALFSFGLLFVGVDAMGGAMAPLAAGARFTGVLALAAERPLLGVTLGAALTAAMQSSSAAVAVLQSLAPLVDARGAIPILLGCNIGATVTALIAAAGRSVDERRAALAHLIFNVSGALACLALLPAFARLVTAVSPAGGDASAVRRQIANAHTLFNLLSTAAWLPFTRAMVALVVRLLPARAERRPETYGVRAGKRRAR